MGFLSFLGGLWEYDMIPLWESERNPYVFCSALRLQCHREKKTSTRVARDRTVNPDNRNNHNHRWEVCFNGVNSDEQMKHDEKWPMFHTHILHVLKHLPSFWLSFTVKVGKYSISWDMYKQPGSNWLGVEHQLGISYSDHPSALGSSLSKDMFCVFANIYGAVECCYVCFVCLFIHK